MTDPKDSPTDTDQPTPGEASDQPETISSSSWSSVQDDQIATLNRTIEDLRASLARSQADYQNLVMRNDRDKAEMVHFLSAKIFTPLLAQIDHLDRAVRIKDGVEGDAFVDGVRNVAGGLAKYLESQGVMAFVSIGEEIDPDRHDVLSQADGPEGQIVREFEKWYTLGDRVLRHAKVIVGNGSVSPENNN